MRQFCYRCGDDVEKRFVWVIDDFFNFGYRITKRESATQPRADQQISNLDVRRCREITNRYGIGRARAEGDGAQAVAIDLHRNSVPRVSNKNGRALQDTHFTHLTTDAISIDDRLARIQTLFLAFGDNNRAPKRLTRHFQ